MTTQHIKFDNGHRVEIVGTSWRHYDQKNVVMNWDVASTPRQARLDAHASVRDGWDWGRKP